MIKGIKKYAYKIDCPKNKTKELVILVPGVSGNSLKDERYEFIKNVLIKNKISLLRLDLWKTKKELEKLSLEKIHKVLDKIIASSKRKGYEKISFIGKSLGGGILLTYKNREIKKLVLLAPAISCSTKSNLKDAVKIPFSKFKSFKDIKINKKDLENINCRVLIIHGTKDKVVNIRNSEKIAALSKKIHLKKINRADHSLKNPDHLKKSAKFLIDFLKK